MCFGCDTDVREIKRESARKWQGGEMCVSVIENVFFFLFFFFLVNTRAFMYENVLRTMVCVAPGRGDRYGMVLVEKMDLSSAS